MLSEAVRFSAFCGVGFCVDVVGEVDGVVDAGVSVGLAVFACSITRLGWVGADEQPTLRINIIARANKDRRCTNFRRLTCHLGSFARMDV